MISSIKFVLLAVMAVQNPNTGYIELQYDPLDYYSSMANCNMERNRLLQKKQTPNKVYLCLKVDRD
jgi:hypothetical protein